MARKGITAAGFGAGLSTAGRAIACVNCKRMPARYDSFYCSESCGRAFLTFDDAPAPVTVVDRWNGSGWTEVTLYWNGAEYVERAPAAAR